MNIAWFSAGITSAIACKWAIENLPNVSIVFIETGSHHADNIRFIKNCENWYNKKIEIISSDKYKNVFDVIEKTRFINSPYSAKCTSVLKKDVRKAYEKTHDIEGQVWGFDYCEKEINRAKRHQANNPQMKCYFPLIENKISKNDAANIIKSNNIEMPQMYRLGYNNNNCIGCVKGGMAYWNKIRIDFPNVFYEMARLERIINRSCIRKYFLDELPIDSGIGQEPFVLDCGSVGEGCEIELSRQYFQYL